jgi:putative integral membrane protein (TIGR02587 family)
MSQVRLRSSSAVLIVPHTYPLALSALQPHRSSLEGRGCPHQPKYFTTRAGLVLRSKAVKSEASFWLGVGRAFGGAIIFSLPLMMTMEMWWLGFYMSRVRLALFVTALIPFLTALSHYRGFEQTVGWIDDLLDAFVAYGIGFASAAIMLPLFGVLNWDMRLDEIAGKLALQAAPGSIGALLARSQLGVREEQDREVKESYGFEIFLMAVGGLFLAFNIAPTKEVEVIAFRMAPWQSLSLLALSLAAMHAFVYFLGFRGAHQIPEQASAFGLFLRYTVAGYAVCLLVSLYVLWTFGRTDGTAAQHILGMVVVLSFPAALGAATARLVL